jgi:uncharacterized protein (DUF934 family)
VSDYDPQRAEWEAHAHRSLDEGRCPHSGARLLRRAVFDGPVDATGDVMACALCDCFGFGVSEVAK